MTQLDFFDKNILSPSESRNKFNYSYSRFETFDSCERKYYYSYYGSKKTKALDEPLKEELIELSELANRHLIIGDILHSVISWFLKTAKKGDLKEYSQIENFAIRRLNNVLDNTMFFKSDGIKKESEFPLPIIKELLYDYYNYLSLKNELEEAIRKNLNNFFNSAKFEDLRNGALTDSAIIEGRSNFNLGNIKVIGKIDLAFEKNGLLTINDWKTGKSHFEETSLQLLIYALWARSKNEFQDKEIIIQKSYLAEDEIDVLKYSESQLYRTKAKIRQQVELLKEMEEFGNQAIESAFPVRKHEKKCRICPFEKICYR